MVGFRFCSILAAALGAASFASAAAIEGQAQDSVTCYTSMNTVPGAAVHTENLTKFTACSKKKTVTVKKTITPARATSTVTVSRTTTITAPATSFTKTSTQTKITTSTVTSTTRKTSLTTTTKSVASTSTVPAPSGFTPIQSSLPGSSCDVECGTNPISKRNERSLSSRNPALHPFALSAQRYPAAVECYTFRSEAQCTTQTVTKTATVTAMRSTTHVTKTTTIKKTIVPSATTTVTKTTTHTTSVTSTATQTAVSTVTQTTVTSSTTLYAACATPNVVDQYNNTGVANLSGSGSGVYPNVTQTIATNPYDCCVAALNYPGGTSQIYAFQINSANCNIVYGATCPSGQSSETFIIDQGSETFAIGNSNCGRVQATLS